jgi:hypothetical protein
MHSDEELCQVIALTAPALHGSIYEKAISGTGGSVHSLRRPFDAGTAELKSWLSFDFDPP